MKTMTRWMFVAAVLCLLPSVAEAARFRYPLAGVGRVSYYRDDRHNVSGIRDYACGYKSYAEHHGTDFAVGVGNRIYAAKAGTVIQVTTGFNTYGYMGNPNVYGNNIRIRHSDGMITRYAHMQYKGIYVRYGQWVNCGTFLGYSGSSGNSSGPHLHFEATTTGGVNGDPFAGSCRSGYTWWVSQGRYQGLPSTACN